MWPCRGGGKQPRPGRPQTSEGSQTGETGATRADEKGQGGAAQGLSVPPREEVGQHGKGASDSFVEDMMKKQSTGCLSWEKGEAGRQGSVGAGQENSQAWARVRRGPQPRRGPASTALRVLPESPTGRLLTPRELQKASRWGGWGPSTGAPAERPAATAGTTRWWSAAEFAEALLAGEL